MSFDWESIENEESEELGFYRLLGEMLQRTATDADLRRVRTYLNEIDPGPDAWHSLGEALFCTTKGSEAGYQVWTEWARRVREVRFDESQQLAAWQRFRISSSDAFEAAADTDAEVHALDEPSTIQMDDLPPAAEFDDDLPTRVIGAGEAIAAMEAPQLLSMIPCGPWTIRVFDDVWDDVDEFALLDLLRHGMLLGIEVLYGGQWVPVARHPGFEALMARMRHEARAVFAGADPVRMETTQPGSP